LNVSERSSAKHLLNAKSAELRQILLEGHPIDPAGLDDTEYRGISLNLPGFVEGLRGRSSGRPFTETLPTAA
jgi:hypothetical protein